jgi:hypothetical protein
LIDFNLEAYAGKDYTPLMCWWFFYQT